MEKMPLPGTRLKKCEAKFDLAESAEANIRLRGCNPRGEFERRRRKNVIIQTLDKWIEKKEREDDQQMG
jgi:hypothetical protein